MLLIVMERFKQGDAKRIEERFRRDGRMLPEWVTYHADWVDAADVRCFQLMEASQSDSLTPWVSRWEDLVDFEIVPVLTSADFWSKLRPE